jgi:hypothetical protein
LCRIGPESRNITRKGFSVPEIIEIAKKIELTSDMLAAAEINVAYSRSGLFSAFAGDQGCWIGAKNWNETQMLSAVAEKTAKLCVRATAWQEASMSTVFCTFLATADSIRVPFRFSGPTRRA